MPNIQTWTTAQASCGETRKTSAPGLHAIEQTLSSERSHHMAHSYNVDSRATTTVDAKIVSGLFDRTTLPDECFKKVVSYMGSLEPRRPWRKDATRANWKRGDVLT